MIKSKIAIIFLFFAGIATAQKVDVESKKFSIPIPKSDFFAKLKYDIIIQGEQIRFKGNDNGELNFFSWDTLVANPDTKDYQYLIDTKRYKDDKNLDKNNPDIRIYAGFKDLQGPVVNADGSVNVRGDFRFIFLGKNNEIILDQNVFRNIQIERNSTKKYEADLANTITNATYDLLDQLLITKNEKEFSFNYGEFEKAEAFPELVTFNTKTSELLVKLQSLNFEDAYLDEMETFFKSYIGKTFGKLKEKEINRAAYVNLALIQLFKVNYTKGYEYAALAKDVAGFLAMWPSNLKSNFDQLQFVNTNSFDARPKFENIYNEAVYKYKFKGTAVYKNKKTFVGTFEIKRFIPTNPASVGALSLTSDPVYKSFFYIFNEKGVTEAAYPNSENFVIKTDTGKEIRYLKYDRSYIVVEKRADNTYIPFESSSTDVYVSPDGEKLELKK